MEAEGRKAHLKNGVDSTRNKKGQKPHCNRETSIEPQSPRNISISFLQAETS